MSSRTALRAAAGVWFVFAFVFAAVAVNDLFKGDAPGIVLGTASALASAWIGYRLLFRFTRDIAVVAATLAAIFVVFSVVSFVQGNLQPFPGGLIVLTLTALAGVLPWRERRRLAQRQAKP